MDGSFMKDMVKFVLLAGLVVGLLLGGMIYALAVFATWPFRWGVLVGLTVFGAGLWVWKKFIED